MGSSLEHPLAAELAAYVDGVLTDEAATMVGEHLGACPTCRVAVARDPGSLGIETPAVRGDAVGTLPAVAGWLASAAEKAARPEPAVGQLWRVASEVDAMLAVVVRVVGERVLVAPAVLEFEMADEFTLVASAARSPIGETLGLWVRLTTLVDRETLEFWVADLPVAAELERAYECFTHDEPLTSAMAPGLPIVDRVDARWLFREELRRVASALSTLPADASTDAEAVETEQPAAASEPVLSSVTASASRDGSYGGGLAALHRALSLVVPEADVVEDPESTTMLGASLPLELAYVAQLVDLRIRVVTAPPDQLLADGGDSLWLEAANLVGLLRDCDRLAVVADDAEFTTYLFDPYEINTDLILVDGGRRKARLPEPEPLDMVFGRLREQNVAPSGLFEGVELRRVDADLAAPAAAASREAVSQEAGRNFAEPKRTAFRQLGADDADSIARFIEESPERGPDDFDFAYGQTVLRNVA